MSRIWQIISRGVLCAISGLVGEGVRFGQVHRDQLKTEPQQIVSSYFLVEKWNEIIPFFLLVL